MNEFEEDEDSVEASFVDDTPYNLDWIVGTALLGVAALLGLLALIFWH